nr:ABC transporter permease subunit [Desulfurococcus amylolyticus]
MKGRVYFKSIFLPSILPSLATGLLSASGGAWNASIAAEFITIRGG